MLGHLNGMFAFCIWDSRTGEAFLAVDHAGIKPLYVVRRDGNLAFASEAKVLLDLPAVSRAVDPVALRQYLTFLWVPAPRTMWRDVRKLAPGSWLSWRDGEIEEGTWWDWDQSEKEGREPDEWVRAVRETLRESVQRQLVSDVPLGILLSGGLDSSALAGAMRAGPTSATRSSPCSRMPAKTRAGRRRGHPGRARLRPRNYPAGTR